MSDLSKFIQFTKVNAAKREVSGTVTGETPDKDNEVCDYEKSKPYYQALISEMTKATDGENCMPLREMHQLSAVGKGIGFNFDDADKEIEMTFKVIDDDAWKKVEERVYTGFSQGGKKVGNQVPDPVFKNCMRYVANPSEISLVDNPCLPTAHFAYVKTDGSVEMRKFLKTEVPGSDPRIAALEAEVSLLKAAKATPITISLSNAAKATPITTAVIPTQASSIKKTKRIGGKDLESTAFAHVPDLDKTETWDYPVHEAGYVRRSIAKMVAAPEKEKTKVRGKIIAAAKKFSIDVPTEETKIAAIRTLMRKAARIYLNQNLEKVVSPRLQVLDADMGKLAKGMWEVSRLACSLEELACLVFSVACEQEYELDENSQLPEMLAGNVAALTQTLVAMVDEETREMLAEVKARVA